MRGLIIENISNLYKVKTEKGIYESVARGKFKKDEITPVVGDNVEIETINEEEKKAVIEQIEKRQVYIKRPKLANITQIILVLSSKHPKPDLLMLDKQLAFSEFLNIKSIIVLNKTDLDKNQDFKTIKNIYEKIGYKVIESEAKNQKGIDDLKQLLKNNINAFSGNSGVGKSTLINQIFKDSITLEGNISEKNKRGKNTTTAIKLYKIDDNSYIADTPGFSTFDIYEIESKDLSNYFIDLSKYIKDCQYIGCSHINEKTEECGIKQALENQKISNQRYETYCKLYNELKEREQHKW